MEKRWDFVSYAIMMFFSGLIVCIFPEQFITGNSDKKTVCIFMIIVMMISGIFLSYKIYRYLKEEE